LPKSQNAKNAENTVEDTENAPLTKEQFRPQGDFDPIPPVWVYSSLGFRRKKQRHIPYPATNGSFFDTVMETADDRQQMAADASGAVTPLLLPSAICRLCSGGNFLSKNDQVVAGESIISGESPIP